MSGNSLKAFRESINKTQSEFYMGMGFQASYGCTIENHYGERKIPKRLEASIKAEYPKEYRRCVK
jgi:hypothetical protein